MQNQLQLIRNAVFAPFETEFSWGALLDALHAVIAVSPSWQAEQALVAVLRFDGQIHLTKDSEVPHSMSPEEILKSLAAQALAKWTGLTYLSELQRLQTMAKSPALASVVQAVIRRASQAKRRFEDLEMVAESDRETHIVERPVADGPGWHVVVRTSDPEPSIINRTVVQSRGFTFQTDRRIAKQPQHPFKLQHA